MTIQVLYCLYDMQISASQPAYESPSASWYILALAKYIANFNFKFQISNYFIAL